MHDLFLQTILESPDDDIPRLVYADWLEEQGDPRGEFIRAQCTLAQAKKDDSHGYDWRVRERELLLEYEETWLGSFAGIIQDHRFHRGFIEEIRIGYEEFVRWRNELPRWAPLRRVAVDLSDMPLHPKRVEGFLRTMAESTTQRMKINLPNEVVEFIPESVARENLVIPLRETRSHLSIAYGEMNDLRLFEKMQFILNRDIEPVEVSRDSIIAVLNHLYGEQHTESVDSVLVEFVDVAIDFDAEAEPDSADPVARLVGLLLQNAVAFQASEIHLEPMKDSYRVRYRINGKLVERDSLPRRLLPRVLAHLKRLARVKAGMRTPLEGSFQLVSHGQYYQTHVWITRMLNGASAVIHLNRA